MTNKENQIQISWKMLLVQIPIIITVLGYLASIEIRMSKYESALELSNRVKNVEDLMLPMLADWKAKKELDKLKKELGFPTDTSFMLPSPMPMPPTPPPSSSPIKMPEKSMGKITIKPNKVDEIENNARNWAESQVRPSLPRVSQNAEK